MAYQLSLKLYQHTIPYLREKAPWAVHHGLGDGPVFKVSPSQLDPRWKGMRTHVVYCGKYVDFTPIVHGTTPHHSFLV